MQVQDIVNVIETALAGIEGPVLTVGLTQEAYDLVSQSNHGKFPPFQIYRCNDGTVLDLVLLPSGGPVVITTVSGIEHTYSIPS